MIKLKIYSTQSIKRASLPHLLCTIRGSKPAGPRLLPGKRTVWHGGGLPRFPMRLDIQKVLLPRKPSLSVRAMRQRECQWEVEGWFKKPWALFGVIIFLGGITEMGMVKETGGRQALLPLLSFVWLVTTSGDILKLTSISKWHWREHENANDCTVRQRHIKSSLVIWKQQATTAINDNNSWNITKP